MAMSETTSIFYDTHAAVRRLITAGMPEPHAEAVVGEQVHLIQYNLATKADIEQIRADVETSRLETKADIESLRQETKADIESLRQETKADIESLRQETKAEIAAVRGDVEKRHLETKAGIEVLRQETKANTETAKNDIVKWIVTMGLAAVVALAGLAVAVIRHI